MPALPLVRVRLDSVSPERIVPSRISLLRRARVGLQLPSPDVLIGDNRPNLIIGREGDDLLIGRGGRDELRGDAGNDRCRPGRQAALRLTY